MRMCITDRTTISLFLSFFLSFTHVCLRSFVYIYIDSLPCSIRLAMCGRRNYVREMIVIVIVCNEILLFFLSLSLSRRFYIVNLYSCKAKRKSVYFNLTCNDAIIAYIRESTMRTVKYSDFICES